MKAVRWIGLIGLVLCLSLAARGAVGQNRLLAVAKPTLGSAQPVGERPAASAPQAIEPATLRRQIAHGAHLVQIMGCNDCHTALKMGPKGPEPDLTRMLAGHPEQLVMPEAPALSGPWMATVSATMTAWSGPWGTSFTANLTPDVETGIGGWTEKMFVDTLRSGKHLGVGRPILPPMPIPTFNSLSDDDLKAVFSYLRSIPAVRNRVPDPIPPRG